MSYFVSICTQVHHMLEMWCRNSVHMRHTRHYCRHQFHLTIRLLSMVRRQCDFCRCTQVLMTSLMPGAMSARFWPWHSNNVFYNTSDIFHKTLDLLSHTSRYIVHSTQGGGCSTPLSVWCCVLWSIHHCLDPLNRRSVPTGYQMGASLLILCRHFFYQQNLAAVMSSVVDMLFSATGCPGSQRSILCILHVI